MLMHAFNPFTQFAIAKSNATINVNQLASHSQWSRNVQKLSQNKLIKNLSDLLVNLCECVTIPTTIHKK